VFCEFLFSVKKLSGVDTSSKMQAEDEELNWFDKDLEDFDIPIPDNPDDEEEEDLADSKQATASRGWRRSRRSTSEAEKTGVVYPVDLWYLLAHHVHPEDIRRFTVLCHDAYATTRTCQFWRNLYRRLDFIIF
jgi:hypothetical protein